MSRVPRPRVPPGVARLTLAAAALAGAACLVAATFTTVIEIRVGTTTRLAGQDTHLSGWDRHGPALLVVAAFAVLMAAGAVRRARPAAIAVAVLGLAALLIAVVGDVPHLHQTGFIGEVYEGATAGPKAGFYLETLGAILLLATGTLMTTLATTERTTHEPRAAAVAD